LAILTVTSGPTVLPLADDQAAADISPASSVEWLQTASSAGRAKVMYGNAQDETSGRLEDFHGFPSPAEIVQHFIGLGKDVPRYLLPPAHEEHIPPHIVAYDLQRRHEAAAACLARGSLQVGHEPSKDAGPLALIEIAP